MERIDGFASKLIRYQGSRNEQSSNRW